MKYYVEILTYDGDWITYAERNDYESAKNVLFMLKHAHKFSTYTSRIRS